MWYQSGGCLLAAASKLAATTSAPCGILKDVPLLETLLSIGVLLLLQYGVTKTIFNSETVADAVKAEPTLLVHEGEFLDEAMRKERVTKSEILAAIQGSGVYDVTNVQWVILETDANLSVVPKQANITTDGATALEGVRGFPPNTVN